MGIPAVGIAIALKIPRLGFESKRILPRVADRLHRQFGTISIALALSAVRLAEALEQIFYGLVLYMQCVFAKSRL